MNELLIKCALSLSDEAFIHRLMEKTKVEQMEVSDNEKWVQDSSIDHKGRTPLRASTGVWKAALFIIAIEFSERLSYFGLSTNLITYLTKFLRYDVKLAAKSVNYWTGVTTLMPLAGGAVADAFLGRYTTVLISSLIYIVGLTVLTMSQLVPGLKPGTSLKLHEAAFFAAMYLISIGTGGHKPCLESFGADQFDNGHPAERRQKLSFFNWWNLGLCSGLLLGVTFVVYLEDNFGFGLAAIVLTCVMLLSLLIFLLGQPRYRYRIPRKSPLTPLLRVLAIAFANRHLSLPPTANQLHETPRAAQFLRHTDKLRFLDKAAIVDQQSTLSRRVATMTQVEELKLVLLMVPIWLTSLPFGICVAQTSTFFIKQGSTMDRKLGAGFEIPPASVYSLGAVAMIISVAFYEKLLVPFFRRASGNERGISVLQRIGVGMALSILGMATAAMVERKRLGVAEGEAAPVLTSMSVFWLVPQFMILGLGDGFAIVGLQEYFYDQMPESMRSLGIALYLSVMGTASFLSGALITAVDHVTGKTKNGSWFAKELNESRLYLFYWLLAAINAANLCVYVFVARRYSYKSVRSEAGASGSPERGGGGIMTAP